MCGIYGWSLNGSATPEHLALANAVLAQCMCERGEDSWGLMTPDFEARRGVGSLMRSKLLKKLPSLNMVSVHTRFATHGARTIQNSHPFEQGIIMGMHNGVLSNHWSLNKQFERNFDVDSQHIFQHIAEGESLDSIEGYGTIVYQRMDTPGDFFIGTFNDGDLQVARLTLKGRTVGVMWASTEEAVKNACAIAGLKPKWVEITDGDVYRISSGEIYTTDLTLDVDYYRTQTKGKYVTSGTWDSNTSSKKNSYTDASGTTWRPSTTDWDEDQEDHYRAKLLDEPCDICGEREEECCCGRDCWCEPCTARRGEWFPDSYDGSDYDYDAQKWKPKQKALPAPAEVERDVRQEADRITEVLRERAEPTEQVELGAVA